MQQKLYPLLRLSEDQWIALKDNLRQDTEYDAVLKRSVPYKQVAKLVAANSAEACYLSNLIPGETHLQFLKLAGQSTAAQKDHVFELLSIEQYAKEAQPQEYVEVSYSAFTAQLVDRYVSSGVLGKMLLKVESKLNQNLKKILVSPEGLAALLCATPQKERRLLFANQCDSELFILGSQVDKEQVSWTVKHAAAFERAVGRKVAFYRIFGSVLQVVFTSQKSPVSSTPLTLQIADVGDKLVAQRAVLPHSTASAACLDLDPDVVKAALPASYVQYIDVWNNKRNVPQVAVGTFLNFAPASASFYQKIQSAEDAQKLAKTLEKGAIVLRYDKAEARVLVVFRNPQIKAELEEQIQRLFDGKLEVKQPVVGDLNDCVKSFQQFASANAAVKAIKQTHITQTIQIEHGIYAREEQLSNVSRSNSRSASRSKSIGAGAFKDQSSLYLYMPVGCQEMFQKFVENKTGAKQTLELPGQVDEKTNMWRIGVQPSFRLVVQNVFDQFKQTYPQQ